MSKKCPDCGCKMDRDYDGEWFCPKCAGYYFSSDSDEKKPSGCRACGNPDYPDCKSSCSMFDD